MLILPIVNKNRILNVEVKLKNADKIRTGVKFSDASESEVIVNGKKLSESGYKDVRSDSAALEFIRNNSIRFRRNYLITTRTESNSATYDVYEVKQPPKKINDGLDNLYTSVITDMRKEIPGIPRGRYLSLEKIGVGDHLTDEKISKLQEIVREVRDTSQWPVLFERAGIADLPDTLEFIKQFDCTVIADTTIPEDSLESMVDTLKKLNTRDSRNLSNYYDMAISNKDIYSKLSFVNKIVNDKPLSLIQSKKQKQKQLIKVNTQVGDANGAKVA